MPIDLKWFVICAAFGIMVSPIAAKDLPRKVETENKPVADKSCSYLGEGYSRMTGTDTCIKVSGRVSAEQSLIFGR